jgi:hypothetical protein
MPFVKASANIQDLNLSVEKSDLVVDLDQSRGYTVNSGGTNRQPFNRSLEETQMSAIDYIDVNHQISVHAAAALTACGVRSRGGIRTRVECASWVGEVGLISLYDLILKVRVESVDAGEGVECSAEVVDRMGVGDADARVTTSAHKLGIAIANAVTTVIHLSR